MKYFKIILILSVLFWSNSVSAQPPTPKGIPETKQWEDWNRARPVIPAPPVMTTPVNGATNVQPNTTIQIQSLGADRLEWRYGTTNPPPLISAQGFSFTPTGQQFNTTYYLRIRGINSTGTTATVALSYTVGPPNSPPTITCPAAISATSNTTAPSPVTWPAPIVSGGQPPVESYVCMPASGDLFPIGMSTSTCSVKDSLSRTAMCTIPITLTYVPAQPVESPDKWRVPRDGPIVVSSNSAVWSFGNDNQCGPTYPHPEWCHSAFNNGQQIGSGQFAYFGFEYEYWKKVLYFRGDDQHWYYFYADNTTPLPSCSQGKPCTAPIIYYGLKSPSEETPTLPPACRDGIDNDGDGKIDFNPPPGFQADPGCKSPDWPTEVDTPPGPVAVADHDGAGYTYLYNGSTYTLPLVYRLYYDGQLFKESSKSEVWNGGKVTMPLPTNMPSGTHVFQMSAAYLCAGNIGCGKTMESEQSLPPVEFVVP